MPFFQSLDSMYKVVLYQSPVKRCIEKTGNDVAPKIILVSYMDEIHLFDESLSNYSKYSYKINQLYALLHDYTVLILTNKTVLEQELDPRWEKVRIFKLLLSDAVTEEDKFFDYFVWFDADLLFLDFLPKSVDHLRAIIRSNSSAPSDEKIRHLLVQEPMLYISSEYHVETGFANTGCFIVRNHAASYDWFVLWYEMMNHSVGHDQVLFDHLYHLLSVWVQRIKRNPQNLQPQEITKKLILELDIVSNTTQNLDRYFPSLVSMLNYLSKVSSLQSFVKVLPTYSLNSLPPAYYTYQDDFKGNHVLHLMGEDCAYRSEVFRAIYLSLQESFLPLVEAWFNSGKSQHSLDIGPSCKEMKTTSNQCILGLNRGLLQWLFVSFAETKIRNGHFKVSLLISNVFTNLKHEVISTNKLRQEVSKVYDLEGTFIILAEIRELLLLLCKLPNHEIGPLVFSLIVGKNLNDTDHHRSYSSATMFTDGIKEYEQYRLFQYLDLIDQLSELWQLFHMPAKHPRFAEMLNANHSFQLLHILTSFGNDFLARFKGNEGYRIDDFSHPLYHSLSISQNERKLPIVFTTLTKEKYFNELMTLLDQLLSVAYSSEQLQHEVVSSVYSMKCILLQNRAQFYAQLLDPRELMNHISSVSLTEHEERNFIINQQFQYGKSALASIQESLHLYDLHLFPHLTFEINNIWERGNQNQIDGKQLLEMYYQINPVMLFEMFNGYSLYASILALWSDLLSQILLSSTSFSSHDWICAKFKDLFQNIPSALPLSRVERGLFVSLVNIVKESLRYYDFSIQSLENLLPSASNLHFIQEHHFQLIYLYAERIRRYYRSSEVISAIYSSSASVVCHREEKLRNYILNISAINHQHQEQLRKYFERSYINEYHQSTDRAERAFSSLLSSYREEMKNYWNRAELAVAPLLDFLNCDLIAQHPHEPDVGKTSLKVKKFRKKQSWKSQEFKPMEPGNKFVID